MDSLFFAAEDNEGKRMWAANKETSNPLSTRQDVAAVEAFGNAIITLKREVKYCKVCHNISDTDTCNICATPSRIPSIVCVVENIKDVDAESVCKYFKKSKYTYYLKNSNYRNYFFEFEIESCE